MVRSRPSKILETVKKREAFLRCLSDEIDDKRDIEDELDISRSTVNRAFCELEESGLLRTDHGGYDLTLHGKLAYQQYQNLASAFNHLFEAMELSMHLPADTQIDTRLLKGGDVTLSDRQTPQKPFEQIKEVVRSASCVKGYLPVVLPSYVDFFHEQIVDRDIMVELVLEETLIPVLTVTYAEKFTPAATSENCILWQTAEELPFGLFIVNDEEVWLCVYRAGGGLRGTLANNTDAALDWALDVFDHYRSSGQRIRTGISTHQDSPAR